MPKPTLTVEQFLEVLDAMLLKLRAMTSDVHTLRDSLMRMLPDEYPSSKNYESGS